MRTLFQGLDLARSGFSRGWKTGVALAVLGVLAAAAGPAAEAPAEAGGGEAAPAGEPALWFPVGEELVYRVHWGAVPVGETRLSSEWIEEDGRRLLRLRLRTRSNKVIAAVYPVDSLVESVIEPASFLPLRFTKNLREGRHRYHETTTFDWERMEAHWVSHIQGTEKTLPLEAGVRDLPSFMFWMRRTGLRPGEEFRIRVMADDKIYDLMVVAADIERIKLDRYGRIPSLKVEPKAEFQGLAYRRGRMWMWISQDPRRLATQVSLEVPVARIYLRLREVTGPGDDFWVKPRD